MPVLKRRYRSPFPLTEFAFLCRFRTYYSRYRDVKKTRSSYRVLIEQQWACEVINN